MKRFLLLPFFAALVLLVAACGKQETAAERQAEIDRQVQQRLDVEHQAADKEKLNQRQADLDAREKALAAKESEPAATPEPESSSDNNPVDNSPDSGSSSTFYRRLDPYGEWLETSDYGYVFQPRPAAESRTWRPYTNGHWVYTDAGWTWISDEQFGWATYHYGRWARLRDVGWVWVPGEEWAPAWVSWRKGNDFVGWAPLPPEAKFNRQTGFQNSVDNNYNIGAEQYAFVPANEFGGEQSAQVVVPAEQNVTIITQTTNVTNITYNNSTVIDRGPSYDDLRARSRHPIQRLRLERTRNFNQERPVIRGEVVAMPAVDLRPADRSARPQRIGRTISQPAIEPRANAQPVVTPPPRKVVRPAAAPKPSTPIPTDTPTPARTPIATPPPPQPTLNPRQAKRKEQMQEKRQGKKAARPEDTVTPTAPPAATTTESPSPSTTATETPKPGKKNRRPGPLPNGP